MKVFLILMLAAVARSQQFQQTRELVPSVRLAGNGFFLGQNEGSSSSFASSGRQEGFQTANFRSGNRLSSQSADLLNQRDQFQQQTSADRLDQDLPFQTNSFGSRSSSSSSFSSSGVQDDSFLLRSQERGSTLNGVFEPLNLPSGASLLFGGSISSSSFTCLDRPYGYYADTDNFCRIFYVCNPALFSDGSVHTYQYSFMCGEGTIFDQEKLTCVMESTATPCQEAPNFYFRNQQFGTLQDRQF